MPIFVLNWNRLLRFGWRKENHWLYVYWFRLVWFGFVCSMQFLPLSIILYSLHCLSGTSLSRLRSSIDRLLFDFSNAHYDFNDCLFFFFSKILFFANACLIVLLVLSGSVFSHQCHVRFHYLFHLGKMFWQWIVCLFDKHAIHIQTICRLAMK